MFFKIGMGNDPVLWQANGFGESLEMSSNSQGIHDAINISFVLGEERVFEVSIPSAEKYLFSSSLYLRICFPSPKIPYKCNSFRV